jgi:hypothetical protein
VTTVVTGLVAVEGNMARSKYIYLIRSAINPATLLGTFTVKHEANTWLMRSEYNQDTARLSRMRDGAFSDKEEEEIPWSEQ